MLSWLSFRFYIFFMSLNFHPLRNIIYSAFNITIDINILSLWLALTISSNSWFSLNITTFLLNFLLLFSKHFNWICLNAYISNFLQFFRYVWLWIYYFNWNLNLLLLQIITLILSIWTNFFIIECSIINSCSSTTIIFI